MRRNFAEGGLRKWVSEKWVDIGAPKNPGGKPTNVATFTKRTKKAMGGYTGPAINSNYGGVTLNNPSYGKYYKGMI